MVELEDSTLLDAQAGVALTRPEGLLFGVSAIGAGSPQMIAADVEELWGSVRDGNIASPAFIASPRGGMYLSMLETSGGAKMFPDARAVAGGTIAGVPLLISPAAAGKLVLLDVATIAIADGDLTIEASEIAAIAPSDAPSTPSNVVSGFQGDTSFLRIIRTLSWVKGYADSVGFISLPTGSPQ